jgi:Uma2 family endonuclease
MIVEVLTKSTESYDRGDKFMHYRRLESLREYIVVSLDKVLVERFTRQGDEWLLTEFRNLNETLWLASIDCAVPLREIYAKIDFPGDEVAGLAWQ